jgi:mRNA interferase MazF
MSKLYPGEIVLVPFPFSDLSRNKIRPALVLACDKDDYTVVFISSVKPAGQEYVEVDPDMSNKLKTKSYVRYTKFASLSKTIIIGKIGIFTTRDYSAIQKALRLYLGL